MSSKQNMISLVCIDHVNGLAFPMGDGVCCICGGRGMMYEGAIKKPVVVDLSDDAIRIGKANADKASDVWLGMGGWQCGESVPPGEAPQLM
jgi:hypothetical protein